MQPEAVDMNAIQAAMERRRNGTMPQAPAAQPQGMPMDQPQVPSPSGQSPAPQQPPMGAGVPYESEESHMIIKALSDRLKQFGSK